MELFLVSLIGYLIGSVPFAYVIGKAFYHTDVRQHGSGNPVEAIQAAFWEKKLA